MTNHEIVQLQGDVESRVEDFIEEYFSYYGIHRDYIERITRQKQPLLDLLGLPSLDSGVVIEQSVIDPPRYLDNIFRSTVVAMNREREQPGSMQEMFHLAFGDPEHHWSTSLRYAAPTDEQFTPKPDSIDWSSMTYKYDGKQHNFLRKLRKSKSFIQRAFLFQFLEFSRPDLPKGVESRDVPTTYDHMLLYLNQDGSVNFDKLWPRVGDLVKPKGRTFLLTCDPVMMLGQSIGKFSSCHTPDGCHKFGPMGYASDSVTVGLFDVRPGLDPERMFEPRVSNMGRCLYYIPDTGNPFYIQARRYGSLQNTDIKPVRDYIGQALRDRNGIPPRTWLVEDSSEVSVQAPECTYIDFPSYGSAYVLSGYDAEDVNIGDAICPICLSRFNNVNGCCISGHEYHCENCGEGVDEDDCYNNGDGIYCRDCYCDLFTECEECGESIYRDDTNVTEDGYTLCQYHYERDTTTCPSCDDTWYHASDMALVETKYGVEEWCSSCATRNAAPCEECGEVFEVDMLNSDDRCSECEEAEEHEEV